MPEGRSLPMVWRRRRRKYKCISLRFSLSLSLPRLERAREREKEKCMRAYEGERMISCVSRAPCDPPCHSRTRCIARRCPKLSRPTAFCSEVAWILYACNTERTPPWHLTVRPAGISCDGRQFVDVNLDLQLVGCVSRFLSSGTRAELEGTRQTKKTSMNFG